METIASLQDSYFLCCLFDCVKFLSKETSGNFLWCRACCDTQRLHDFVTTLRLLRGSWAFWGRVWALGAKVWDFTARVQEP